MIAMRAIECEMHVVRLTSLPGKWNKLLKKDHSIIDTDAHNKGDRM